LIYLAIQVAVCSIASIATMYIKRKPLWFTNLTNFDLSIYFIWEFKYFNILKKYTWSQYLI
jgi:hypothetical protein